MGEQVGRILRHLGGMIGGRLIELLALPMAAIIEGDRAPACAPQGLEPICRRPVDVDIRAAAVDQEDRFALPFVDEGDLDPVRKKALPRHCHRRSPLPIPPAAGYCPATKTAVSGRDLWPTISSPISRTMPACRRSPWASRNSCASGR